MNTPLSTLLLVNDASVVTVGPEVLVGEAVRKMIDHNIGSLVVLDGGRLAGIFTERDVLIRVAAGGFDPESTPVGKVMTRRPIYVAADMSVEDAMILITEKRIRHLPVLDKQKVIGLVSIGDLARWVVRDQLQRVDDLNFYITDTPEETGSHPLF